LPDLQDWHERVELEAKAVQRLLKQARPAAAPKTSNSKKDDPGPQGTSEDAVSVREDAGDSDSEPSDSPDGESDEEEDHPQNASLAMPGRGSRESRRTETREELLARLLDPTLTLEETARVLEVCPTTVRRYTNRGILPHERSKGNQRRFKLSCVLAFLESQSRAEPPHSGS
jgi:excisionase family DNA binding protein